MHANVSTGNSLRTGAGTNADASFPRTARLLTAADYSPVFKTNKRLTDKYWTVLVHKVSSPEPKLGLAIAKKRAKRAVDRNVIKRVAREAFRHSREKLRDRHLVIMNRDAATAADKHVLRTSLDKLLARAS